MKAYHVLVIEDNEQNLYLAQFLLERHGFRVSSARSGAEGLSLAAADLPDLILLDIQLPEMDGYTVASELRKRPALRDVPIVAVTSYAMVGDRERALSSGASDYIEKPIDPKTFVARISVHLPESASAVGAHVEVPDRTQEMYGNTRD
jgi:CheY-like chemotaxis protein